MIRTGVIDGSGVLGLAPLLLGLVLVPLAVAAAIVALRKGPPTLLRDLCAARGRRRAGAAALWLAWFAVFGALALGLLWTLGAGVPRTLSQAGQGDPRGVLLALTGLTAALCAAVALPFTLLRTGFAAVHDRIARRP